VFLRKSAQTSVLCLGLALAVGTTPVMAVGKTSDDPPAVLSRSIDIRVLKQDLQQVAQTFAEQAGLQVTLGKGLSRTISNVHLTGSAAQALDVLAEHVGAVWWWTGTNVRMVDRSDLVTKTIKRRDIDQMLATAKSLGVPVDLLTTQKADTQGIVRVTGPSGLVAELEALVQDIAETDGKIHVTRYGKRRQTTQR
jgi:hypothetical protein